MEAPAFSGLDHAEYWVASALQSAAFYVRVFGGQPFKNRQTQRRYVRLGESYLAMDQPADQAPGQAIVQSVRMDHVCAGARDFDIAAVHAWLMEKGIAYRDYPSGRDLAITEPGGQRVQIARDRGWESISTSTAAPDTSFGVERGVFQAERIDQALLAVSDRNAATRFVGQVFEDLHTTDGYWYRVGNARLGLVQTAVGQAAGLAYLRIKAAPFRLDSAIAQLQALGAKQVLPLGAGELEFSDSDGYRTRVFSS